MTETKTQYRTRVNDWDTIRHRLETAAQSVGGGCVVMMAIVAVDGVPISWTRPDVLPFEPRRNADRLAKFLMFGTTGVDESEKTIQGE